jgi:hypothetical protein
MLKQIIIIRRTCKLVELSHIEFQRNIRNNEWDTLKNSFRVLSTLNVIMDHYGCKSQLQKLFDGSFSHRIKKQ